MNIRRLVGLALLAFAAFYAITNPAEAAHATYTVAPGIGSSASVLAAGGN